MATGTGAHEQYTYEGMTMIKIFPAESLDKIKVFDYRDDDVLVVTYPKAGMHSASRELFGIYCVLWFGSGDLFFYFLHTFFMVTYSGTAVYDRPIQTKNHEEYVLTNLINLLVIGTRNITIKMQYTKYL